MYVTIVLLHFLAKVGMVIILTSARYLQIKAINMKQSRMIGDIIVIAILWGILSTVIESRIIMFIIVVMIMSSTMIVDYVIAEQLKIADKKKKKKLAIAQILYVIEMGALIWSFRSGYWGETELIILNKLSNFI